MTVTSTTSTTGAPPATTVQAPGSSLGQDDFLRLLATELQYQDPMNPTDDKDFMAQMAQFSALEQMQNVAGGVAQLGQQNDFAEAVGLIGREVGYTRADGTAASGVATGVSTSGGTVTIAVGADEVGLDAIRSVAAATGGSTAP